MSKNEDLKSFNKHIIIAGSARSGTSWLSEIIGLQYRYRLLFEPEHEHQTQEGYLICDKLITAENVERDQKKYFVNIFKNQVDNDWIAQLSNRKFKRHLWPVIPKKYVIKFVRCNMSAHYIAQQYSIPIVYVIRNPYDVIASQQRVKFPWLYNLNRFKNQDLLCNMLMEHYNFDLRNQKELSDIEKLSIRWCIENSIPFLLNKNDSKYTVYKYEDIKNDINVFLEICKSYNLKPLSNIETAYNQPSSKTHPKSEIITGTSKNLKFTDLDYKTINYYLDLFKIDFYKRNYSL